MGIENNIKADYPDCKVKRPAIKNAIQKLLDAGTIRNGASLSACLCINFALYAYSLYSLFLVPSNLFLLLISVTPLSFTSF